jgi:hypothetical protein
MKWDSTLDKDDAKFGRNNGQVLKSTFKKNNETTFYLYKFGGCINYFPIFKMIFFLLKWKKVNEGPKKKIGIWTYSKEKKKIKWTNVLRVLIVIRVS